MFLVYMYSTIPRHIHKYIPFNLYNDPYTPTNLENNPCYRNEHPVYHYEHRDIFGLVSDLQNTNYSVIYFTYCSISSHNIYLVLP